MPRGLIVMTGCGHPGPVMISREAKEFLNDEVLFVMGGFCLEGKDEGTIKNIIKETQNVPIYYIAPSHCSGELAMKLFREAYHDRYIEIGTGKRITLSSFNREIEKGRIRRK